MTPFYELSRRSRIRRLRLAALDVLRKCAIDVVKMVFISSSYVVFRVWANSKLYMLRFCNGNFGSIAAARKLGFVDRFILLCFTIEGAE